MTSASSNFLSPMAILDKARKAVPAVNYALGVAGIAAAAAIVSLLVGNNNSAIILLSSSFVAMILLYIFSRLVVSTAPSIQFAGVFLVWVILVFFATFLLLTTTAFMWTWPCNWARYLGATTHCSFASGSASHLTNPTYTTYTSPDLRLMIAFPNNILTLDNTDENKHTLVLRDSNGQTLVKVLRTTLPDHKSAKLGREKEITDLKAMEFAVTYIAPVREQDWSNWYVVSGLSHGTEFYYRRWYCENNIVSIEFRYPKELTPLFDILIPKMTHDLTMSNCG